jgi:bifunctional polynucleotide phosphatase/kinase
MNKFTNKWINNDNYTFFFNNENISNCKKILIFDLDGTLIKTKSGRVHPLNCDDWVFNYDNVKTQINNLTDTIIGIITNQNGIRNNEKLIEWQTKINNIIKEIKVNFIFASLKIDKYRKPMDGSWNYIKDILINNFNVKIPKNIIFVGDACGRNTDFSDTDLKFAYNCNFKIKTPEQFFNITKTKQLATLTYPIIEYYTKNEFSKYIDKINNCLNKNKVLIMLIGFPSCGKSFIRKYIINNEPKFKYYNKDDIKLKIISENLITKNNSSINYIIDDNTNTTLKNREKIYKIYNNHYKLGIFFDYDINLSNHLNFMRMYWFGGDLISKVAYNTINKYFDKPNTKEFDMLITFDKILPDFNYNSHIKYYF